MIIIKQVETEFEKQKCFKLFREFVPDLDDKVFFERIKQLGDDYHLVVLQDDEDIVTAAGFRIIHTLSWGKVLYIDELITVPRKRGKGYGSKLFAWLKKHARKHHCTELHLDSALYRHKAHVFYEKHNGKIICHHFSFKID